MSDYNISQQKETDDLRAERDKLMMAYKELFQLSNHAFCFNNFKILQDNMREHQTVAKELGIYP